LARVHQTSCRASAPSHFCIYLRVCSLHSWQNVVRSYCLPSRAKRTLLACPPPTPSTHTPRPPVILFPTHSVLVQKANRLLAPTFLSLPCSSLSRWPVVSLCSLHQLPSQPPNFLSTHPRPPDLIFQRKIHIAGNCNCYACIACLLAPVTHSPSIIPALTAALHIPRHGRAVLTTETLRSWLPL
jgi:hypothetical protein